MRKYHQGKYKVKNPSKYKGDPTNVIYRSSWELEVIKTLDNNPNVIEWGSEEVQIPYVSPADGQIHRYFVDFYVKLKNKKGEIKVILIEVKPYSQTLEPEMTDRKSKKTYLNEVMTYGVNKSKWKSATNFCKERGWEFKILTEHNIKGI